MTPESTVKTLIQNACSVLMILKQKVFKFDGASSLQLKEGLRDYGETGGQDGSSTEALKHEGKNSEGTLITVGGIGIAQEAAHRYQVPNDD